MPVPRVTTFFRISFSNAAVFSEITRTRFCGGGSYTVFPSSSMTRFTIRGSTNSPPVATALTARMICNGVTPISCPMEMLAGETTRPPLRTPQQAGRLTR